MENGSRNDVTDMQVEFGAPYTCLISTELSRSVVGKVQNYIVQKSHQQTCKNQNDGISAGQPNLKSNVYDTKSIPNRFRSFLLVFARGTT